MGGPISATAARPEPGAGASGRVDSGAGVSEGTFNLSFLAYGRPAGQKGGRGNETLYIIVLKWL